MRPLIVIPARGGSRRLPGKNLRLLCGRSLLAHTAEFLSGEGLLKGAILSTDDAGTAEEGRKWGLDVPFIRPPELATDEAATYDVVSHALAHHRAVVGVDPDAVCVLQVTSPIRRPGLLRNAMTLLEADRQAASAIAMSRLHVATRYVYTPSGGGRVVPVGSGGGAALVPSGSLYLARTGAFESQRTLLAAPVLALEVSIAEAIDIDTATDFMLAEAWLKGGCPAGTEELDRAQE